MLSVNDLVFHINDLKTDVVGSEVNTQKRVIEPLLGILDRSKGLAF